MVELLEVAFSGVNIAYTILLILILVYWCIVFLGILDFGALDLDVDANVDLDADLGMDADADAGFEGTEGGFSWLAFFNVGEVPVMFYATIVALTMWVVSIQMNHLLDNYATGWVANYRGSIAVAMAAPNLIFALFLAKFFVMPAKRLRHRPQQVTKLEGKVCLVTSPQVDENYGRCETPKEEGSLIINVRTRGGEVLRRGDPVEIVEHVVSEEAVEDFYIVTRKVWVE